MKYTAILKDAYINQQRSESNNFHRTCTLIQLNVLSNKAICLVYILEIIRIIFSETEIACFISFSPLDTDGEELIIMQSLSLSLLFLFYFLR